jgi:hypothetical protein
LSTDISSAPKSIANLKSLTRHRIMISLIMNALKAWLATSEPKAIGVPTRDTPWITGTSNVLHLLHPDGSTQEGAAFREPSKIVKYLVSFSTVLSKAGVGPVIA